MILVDIVPHQHLTHFAQSTLSIMKAAVYLLIFFVLHGTSSSLVIDTKYYRAKKSLPYPPQYAPQAPSPHIPNPITKRSKLSDKEGISIDLPLAAPTSFQPSGGSTNNPDINQNSAQNTSETWVFTAETVFVAVFRAVITAISVINVTMTWRIRREPHITSSIGEDRADDDTRHPCRTSMAPRNFTSASRRAYLACVSLMFSP